MTEKILLGFSVPDGKPVYVPLHHLVVIGMTQLSGKTTTLEALISRSGLQAIAFKTKRGEAGFREYKTIEPYYKPRSDWQFIEGLVNVALGEKVKYEAGMRSAIMRATRGTRDLKDVREKAHDLSQSARSEFMKQVFERLVAYLDIVIPELDKWTFSQKIELDQGVNVMDLTGMRLETQQLVIASTIQYAFDKLSEVVLIVPEAWEMIPEFKMTPVKWVAEQFIRKGASVGNYLWLDSQDIGGVSKVPLRQCDNWIMGRMREAHEVERILKQLIGVKIPRKEIQTLKLGHFFAVVGDKVSQVYVLPTGVSEDVGIAVAKGSLTPEFVRDKYLLKKESEENMSVEELKKDVAEIKRALRERSAPTPTEPSTTQVLNLEERELIVNLSHTEKPIEMNTDNQLGQIMFCAVKDLPKGDFSEKNISDALDDRGWHMAHSSLAPNLAQLVKRNLLIKDSKLRPIGYRLPSKLTIHVKEK
jgi:hypothetical protein